MNLIKNLIQVLSDERVHSRYIDRIAYASDASFYHLVPKVIVQPVSIQEIQKIFKISQKHKIPVTFRAAGTSLSGQSITDGILLDISKYWKEILILDNGQKIKVQSGVIGDMVNKKLKSFNRKIGPDPASINACMVGGIVANNSSGMCCGVEFNSYHTVESLTFILPDGSVIDTSNELDRNQFDEKYTKLSKGLSKLKSEIESNPELKDKIRNKYKIKNTTGYSLNAFIDFEKPIDILRNLLIGSEGTLAFIVDTTFRTIPDEPYKYTGLLVFPDIFSACSAILPLKESGAKALEIMDRNALKSVESLPIIQKLGNLSESATAILVEYQSDSKTNMDNYKKSAESIWSKLELTVSPDFTEDSYKQAELWKIRKGMFPSVGAMRNSGTTVIIEDVAFPIESLAKAVVDLQELFIKHGYLDAIIFGHAKDGNLHFVIKQSFNEQANVDQYKNFMDDIVTLVVKKYNGALKAEHGTGRNMAPFVQVEWGAEAYRIMKELKDLLDPENLINPGVIINADASAHVQNLKSIPTIDSEIDKCIECGFCEPKCPSRNLTLSPRRRIIVRREMKRVEEKKLSRWLELSDDYVYDAMDTCATDGLCATACPVGIDTGKFIKRLRYESNSKFTKNLSMNIAKHFDQVEGMIQIMLSGTNIATKIFGKRGAEFIIGLFPNLIESLSRLKLPEWKSDLPKKAKPLPITKSELVDWIYFPTCITRTMGKIPDEPVDKSIPEMLIEIASSANIHLNIPQNVQGKCCGTPFSSKGYKEAYQYKINEFVENCYQWTEKGKIPIVMDTSPCTYTVKTCRDDLTQENQIKFDSLKIFDIVEFLEVIIQKLNITQLNDRIVLHPVCSVTKMNLDQSLKKVAEKCTESVEIPDSVGCCGFAGDRGMLFPELTQSATFFESSEVKSKDYDGYYSTSRTCEVGMSRGTGKIYSSIVYLVYKALKKE